MINQDLSLISQHYLKNGFIIVFIEKPDVMLIHNPDYSRVDVRLKITEGDQYYSCLLYTSPSPRDGLLSRMPSSA